MEARLCFMGHALMENRSGLLVDTCLTQAGGHAERVAALAMIEPRAERSRPVTLGADRGFDAADFVNELRTLNVRPHVAQNTTRRSAIDGRTTRHAGYAASQRIRKRIEEAFGWMKSVGGMRRPMLRGLPRMGFAFTFAAAAYNLGACRGSWREPQRERLGQSRRGPLAHHRGRSLGPRASRPLRLREPGGPSQW
jgi:hypothetical protein